MLDPADANLAETPARTEGDGASRRQQPAVSTTGEQSTDASTSAEAWLDLVCGLMSGATRAVVFLHQPGGAPTAVLVPVAHWPVAEGDFARLEAVAAAAAEKARTVVRPHARPDGANSADVHDLAHPIGTGTSISGIVAIEMARCPEARLPEVVRQLQTATAHLPLLLDGGKRARRMLPAGGALASALWLVGSCLEHDRFRGASTAVATDMAAQLDCERVAIGFVDGQQVKVQALSHSADFGERMNLIRRISAAMDEAVDQRTSVVVPQPPGVPSVGTSAHEELIREEGSLAACTVLLTWNDHIIGAVSLERDRPFSDDEVATLEDTASLLGPILELKRRDDRWLIRKALDALRNQARKLVGPRHLGLKVAAIVIVAAIAYLSVATGTFRVSAPATLEGAVMRVAVAPIDGFIVQAPARAGDLVRAGDVLAVLDDRDLRLELRNLQSQREQIESEYLEAMAQQERVEMNLLATRMEQADVQLDLITDQLARLTITAPIDGVVVSGDLSQSIGAPVQQGDALYEVAPLDSYRLMLRVDERDVAYVATEQRGAVVLASLPQATHEFTVSKVTPVSSSEEGTTYFLVEATLDEAMASLRPGMEGVGKIDIAEARRIWIVTRRMTDWLRLWVWAWRGPGA
jgi:multidrug resistance efflux pump